MGRRTILLVAAALAAVLGSGIVFLYVRAADDRALQGQAPVAVLKASAVIEPGESLAAAQAAGKLALEKVPSSQVLVGAKSSVETMTDMVALSRIFPNEQITDAKFGDAGTRDPLNIDDGNLAISVNLTDTGRVAGFVSPGSHVVVFYSGEQASQSGTQAAGVTRVLLPKVKVIAVAQTTVSTSTVTDSSGAQTTESLPRTLFTLSVNQKDAERVIYASSHGELSFGLLNDKSHVQPDLGVSDSNLFG